MENTCNASLGSVKRQRTQEFRSTFNSMQFSVPPPPLLPSSIPQQPFLALSAFPLYPQVQLQFPLAHTRSIVLDGPWANIVISAIVGIDGKTVCDLKSITNTFVNINGSVVTIIGQRIDAVEMCNEQILAIEKFVNACKELEIQMKQQSFAFIDDPLEELNNRFDDILSNLPYITEHNNTIMNIIEEFEALQGIQKKLLPTLQTQIHHETYQWMQKQIYKMKQFLEMKRKVSALGQNVKQLQDDRSAASEKEKNIVSHFEKLMLEYSAQIERYKEMVKNLDQFNEELSKHASDLEIELQHLTEKFSGKMKQEQDKHDIEIEKHKRHYEQQLERRKIEIESLNAKLKNIELGRTIDSEMLTSGYTKFINSVCHKSQGMAQCKTRLDQAEGAISMLVVLLNTFSDEMTHCICSTDAENLRSLMAKVNDFESNQLDVLQKFHSLYTYFAYSESVTSFLDKFSCVDSCSMNDAKTAIILMEKYKKVRENISLDNRWMALFNCDQLFLTEKFINYQESDFVLEILDTLAPLYFNQLCIRLALQSYLKLSILLPNNMNYKFSLAKCYIFERKFNEALKIFPAAGLSEDENVFVNKIKNCEAFFTFYGKDHPYIYLEWFHGDFNKVDIKQSYKKFCDAYMERNIPFDINNFYADKFVYNIDRLDSFYDQLKSPDTTDALDFKIETIAEFVKS